MEPLQLANTVSPYGGYNYSHQSVETPESGGQYSYNNIGYNNGYATITGSFDSFEPSEPGGLGNFETVNNAKQFATTNFPQVLQVLNQNGNVPLPPITLGQDINNPQFVQPFPSEQYSLWSNFFQSPLSSSQVTTPFAGYTA